MELVSRLLPKRRILPLSLNEWPFAQNVKNIYAMQNLGIYHFSEQEVRIDVFLYDVAQVDTEEVITATGEQRRFEVNSAHGYAALSYALLLYALVHNYSENSMGGWLYYDPNPGQRVA